MLITVFYYIILKMKNFWDLIFLQKISEINGSGYDFRETEKVQLQFEQYLAQEKIEGNKRFRKIFLIVFSALNISIFAIQAGYIFTCSSQNGTQPSRCPATTEE